MEITESHLEPTAEPQIILTDEAQYYLQKAGQWAYFLGIIGFIVTGFIVIAALFAGAVFSAMAKLNPMTPYPANMGVYMTFFYMLIAAFNFFFSLYIYQFGNRIKNAILYNNTQEVTVALGKLKSFFKLWGIATIVVIAVYILAFIGLIIAGINAASVMRGGTQL